MLGIAALIAGIVFWRTSEYFARHRLAEGKIGKVRVLQVDPNESIAILDFSLTNDTNHQIVVRSLQPSFDMADGSPVDGRTVAARDVDSLFRNYPELGVQYNAPLKAQDVLPANGSADYMAAVSFEVPQDVFKKRKDIVLRVDTNGGVVAELKTP